jgi:putative ABC transport system permease protein
MLLAAVTIGVAFVVATWVLSDSVVKSATGERYRTDVAVAVQRDPGAPGIAPQEFPPGHGVVRGAAELIGPDGKLVDEPPLGAATNWDTTPRFRLTAGRGPRNGHEVALLDHENLGAVGATAVFILPDGERHEATIVGRYAYLPLGTEDAPTVAFDDATALTAFGGTYDRVEYTSPPPGLRAGPGRTLRTGDALRAEARERLDRTVADLRWYLLAFAAVALLAGTFVIANTFAMLVTRRTREYALLRAVGATKRQVRARVVREAALLGAAGATAGAVLGTVLGIAGVHLAAPAGTAVEAAVSPVGILVGYAVGIGVTVVAAYGSVRRAASIPPVAALRADATLPRRSLVTRGALGAATLALGLVLIAATAPTHVDDLDRLAGLGGALLLWIGVILLGPLLAIAVLGPLARHAPPGATLAFRNAVRDPRRTAATAASLTVGLALVCAFATVGASFVALATANLEAQIPAATTVIQPALSTGSLTDDVPVTVAQTPGVSAVLAVPRTTAKLQGAPASLSAVDPVALARTLHLTAAEGDADPRHGLVLLRADAEGHHLRPGDPATVTFADGTARTVPVAGIYDGTEGSTSVYIDEALVPVAVRGPVTAVYATGSEPDLVRASLSTRFRVRPDVLVSSRQGAIDRAVAGLKVALAIIYGLFGAALIVAVFGVVNTLALSVLERTRELGLLRAVGASRRTVRRTVRVESVVICAYGGVLGVAVGVALGAVMQHLMLSTALTAVAVPWPVLGIALLGMLVVGVLASLGPARRAARTSILSALAPE